VISKGKVGADIIHCI